MAAAAGRALRIKYSSDGITYTAITGATQDGFTITREGINITDKDDSGVQTFLDSDVGSWAMEGTIEGVLVDDTLMDILKSTDNFTAEFQVDVAAIGTWEGKFGITSFNPTGADGNTPITFTATLTSSGAISYTAD